MWIGFSFAEESSVLKAYFYFTKTVTMKFHHVLLISLIYSLNVFNSKAQSYFLNGDAIAIGGDCYQLTNSITNQNGTVWYADQLDLNEPFTLEFLMNFGGNDINGADGMVFVLQTVGTDAIGENGEGIGFSGFEPSLGIEFDTYQNSALGDPTQDHLAILKNGDVNHNGINNIAGPVVTSAFSNNVEDNVDHIIRIEWDPEVQDIEVWVDCELRLITGYDLVNDIFGGDSMVWFGFTAATGGLVNTQVVCLQENILSVDEDVSICNGSSIQLNAAGNPNGSFSWTPSTGLSNANIQNPIASPESTTTYTVTYTDFCDNTISADVTVNVEDLEVTASNEDILTCYEPTLEISGSNNFSSDVSYSWSTMDGNILGDADTEDITVDAPGTYSVEANFQDECFAETEITVDADFLTYDVSIDDAPNIDCNNTSVELNAQTDGELVVIEWNSPDGFILEGENSLTPTINDGGTYTITLTNPDNGCESEESISIENLISFPFAEAGPSDTVSCTNPIVFLDGTQSDVGAELSYLWTSGNGIIAEDQSGLLNPAVTEAGNYVLTVTNNDNGCSSLDSVLVFFDESSLVDPDLIIFPNIFTPNNDSINEYFRPVMRDLQDYDLTLLMDNYELRVFNRWGNIVYETSGRVKFWDGYMTNGEPPSDGVYYYTVKYTFICGETREEERSGVVEIRTTR